MLKRNKTLTLDVCPKCNTTLNGNHCPSCGYTKKRIRKRIIVAFAVWIFLMLIFIFYSSDDTTTSDIFAGGGSWLLLLLGLAWLSLVMQKLIVRFYKSQIEPCFTQDSIIRRTATTSDISYSNADTQEIKETAKETIVEEVENELVGYDAMDGHDFEYFCANILSENGFKNVEVTKGSGDQGIDIIAFKDDVKYGIQCKRYSSTIGNKAVQEAFAGKTFYGCHVAVVLTNQYFSSSAMELAQKNGVILWNRDKLDEMIEKVEPSLIRNTIKARTSGGVNMENKKYCKHCGQLIDISCVVCPKCGKQVEMLATSQSQNRQNDRPIIINNSSSSSATSYVNTGYKRKLPWYLKTFWIIILGILTGGIYWFVGPILRINWRSHN
ncbi:MAG: restriction endonuclease [Lachnospiraceae bacterium]